MKRTWRVRRTDRAQAPAHGPGEGPVVVLDNIRSAYNVGAIFRTCEAAGVRHLHLCGISAAPPNPKVVKTALGAERMVPWTHTLSTLEVLDALHAAGLTIVAVELTDRSVPYTRLEYGSEIALIFGHEVAGIAVPCLERADHVAAIPMLGRKNSLNVATSVGVVLFELVRRQRAREMAERADS